MILHELCWKELHFRGNKTKKTGGFVPQAAHRAHETETLTKSPVYIH